jgi:arylsulfatase A-like enzyme
LKKQRDRKFFLFLHGYDAHGQFMPSKGFDYRFVEQDYDEQYRGTPQEQEILREEGLERGRVKLRDADARFWRAIYDEKIQRADAWIGQFLEAVDALGLREKTIIVITSDHGTEVYEHQRFDHGFTLYQELLHVPLVIALPKQDGRQSIEERASSIDLMPTLLDLLDIKTTDKVSKQLRGKSLAPALQGERIARDVISETDYRQFTFKRSIIDAAGYKLIYTLESRTRELYDLNKDPGETKDLAGADPSRADELQRRLFAHYRAIGHDLKSQRWEVGLNPVYNSQAKP